MAKKNKRDILLELRQAQPDITPEAAAEKAECTLAYAKRILAAEQEKMNSDIMELGRKLGLREDELQDWYDWIVKSLSNPRAVKCFRDTVLHQKYLRGEF